MISKYITENGKFRQIDEFMPGTWINLTAPTQDESLEIARRYNVDLAISGLHWTMRSHPVWMSTMIMF